MAKAKGPKKDETAAKLESAGEAKAPADVLATFYEDLTKNANDWQVRGLVADWHEDHGKVEVAECLRWMLKKRKRPYGSSGKSFTWFNADTISQGLGDPESDVPGAVYQLLQGGSVTANHRAYRSLREADEAFQAAWAEARKRGWSAEA